jgi:hypothetical protein
MRGFLVRLSCPWVFRSPAAHARHLRKLAATEQGSYLSLQWAAQRSTPLDRQAHYLRHAADEARHAHLFWSRAQALDPPHGPLLADAEDLFSDLGEIGFVAFVHHAERRGREQFECYQRYFARSGRSEDAALFLQIGADERHHESYSKKLLVELSGSEVAARKHLRQVQFWEAWRSWKRAGQSIARVLYSLLIWALFPVLLPYSLFMRLLPQEPTGFRQPSASKIKTQSQKELPGG